MRELMHEKERVHFITFPLCLSVTRIDTPPLQPEAVAFVSYGFVLVRVRVPSSPDSVFFRPTAVPSTAEPLRGGSQDH